MPPNTLVAEWMPQAGLWFFWSKMVPWNTQ